MQISDQRKKNRNSLDNNYKQLTSSDEETFEEISMKNTLLS